MSMLDDITSDQVEVIAIPLIAGMGVDSIRAQIENYPIEEADIEMLKHWPEEPRARVLSVMTDGLNDIEAWVASVREALVTGLA